jgi:hypothetical protein
MCGSILGDWVKSLQTKHLALIHCMAVSNNGTKELEPDVAWHV